MTLIERRESDERKIIDALLVDQACKDALYRAFCRSYAPNAAARSRALAEVMRVQAERIAGLPVAAPARFSMVEFANRLLGRGVK